MTIERNVLNSFCPTFQTKCLALLFIISATWWLIILSIGSKDTLANNLYGLILGFIPFWGGLFGISLSRKWGFWSSAIGKAIILLSFGLLSWSTGTFIFAGYYNLYAGVDVPYPSWADAAYIISLPFWTIGMIYLAKATGAKFGMRSSHGKPILFFIPITVIALSYYLLIVVARGGVIDLSDSGLLKIFFDFAYPIGDVLILTVVTLIYGLSYNYLGGKFRTAIYLILTGFVTLYIADFTFSYTTTLGIYYTADWVDFLFVVSMSALSLGVNLIDIRFLSPKEGE